MKLGTRTVNKNPHLDSTNPKNVPKPAIVLVPSPIKNSYSLYIIYMH